MSENLSALRAQRLEGRRRKGRRARGRAEDLAGRTAHRPGSPGEGHRRCRRAGDQYFGGEGSEGVRVSPSASAKPTASKAEKKADKKAEKKATREAFARPQSIEEAAKPQNRAAFRAAVALYGLFMIAYGLWQVFGGVSAVPDAPTDFANSSVQSNYVFFASTYVGVGLSFVFIALKFKWVNMLAFSCLVVFLGGVGRILSWVNFGTPNWILIVLMVTELVIPALPAGVVRLDQQVQRNPPGDV